MTVTAAQVSATSTPAALNAASQDGMHLTVRNGSGATVALGPADVAIGTGLTVPVSTYAPILFVKPGDVLYVVCATTSTVEVLRT